ncbi:MAG: pH-response regulator protein palH/rim21 [Claussenomyces sp. TS43310]|nr:MAG: pH-response regulator protein palH/rim21 [Claussenomyces sp. TS43310]
MLDVLKPPRTRAASTIQSSQCTPFSLPAYGIIEFGTSSYITLTSGVLFQPQCTGNADTNSNLLVSESLDHLRDPFYASTTPQCYVLAATTVCAYMLVIMLLITPRTFLSGGMVVLGRRGFTNRPSGADGVVGIGGRPWLQKVATLTVAISLTIATVDTFVTAEAQYDTGYMDARALQNDVMNGLELLIIRTISITFLWLAQAQTLIRLFPRQREKVIIKWTAFALVGLELIFACLDNFVYRGYSRPDQFRDAVPALSYIFDLALSLLYCVWVIYYAITKRKYAWYHPQMRNICLVACLSLIAILIPIVFFCVDMADSDLASWGIYVRWVGSAAASVVVWEWVERIEALERIDNKDGVLGREVFDGDEMLETTPLSGTPRPSQLSRSRSDGPDGGSATGADGQSWSTMAGIANRYRQHLPQRSYDTYNTAGHPQMGHNALHLPTWPARPPPAVTPVNRNDTASAGSTEYSIRYYSIPKPGQPTVEPAAPPISSQRTSSHRTSLDIEAHSDEAYNDASFPDGLEKQEDGRDNTQKMTVFGMAYARMWRALEASNPFRKKAQHPPPEIFAHTPSAKKMSGTNNSGRRDVLGRLENFASTHVETIFDRSKITQDSNPLPVTRIPAPQRRRTAQQMVDLVEEAQVAPTAQTTADSRLSPALGSNTSQSSPSNDIYTPAGSHRVTQQGRLSFIASIQQDGDRHTAAVAETFPPLRGPSSEYMPRNLQSSNYTLSTASRSLPVRRVPAPPRRKRREEEGEE